MFPSGPPKSGSLGSGVSVAVEVEVAVPVEVGVDVDVAVEVDVCAGVAEAVGVEVDTGWDFAVEEGGGGIYPNVFVDVAKTRAVLVANAAVVGGIVCAVTNVVNVCEGTAEAVEADVLAAVESCVMAENEAPGVRAAFIHAGFVRMAESTGSMNPTGLFVRKSLFGSSLDCTFVSNSQRGVKRSAQPPAIRIPKSPNRRMRAITAQSRLSFSVAFISKSA